MMMVYVGLTSQAVASATEIAIGANFDRNPDNVDIPKDTRIKIDGAHTFENGFILGNGQLAVRCNCIIRPNIRSRRGLRACRARARDFCE